jgi:hypothetical protein
VTAYPNGWPQMWRDDEAMRDRPRQRARQRKAMSTVRGSASHRRLQRIAVSKSAEAFPRVPIEAVADDVHLAVGALPLIRIHLTSSAQPSGTTSGAGCTAVGLPAEGLARFEHRSVR